MWTNLAVRMPHTLRQVVFPALVLCPFDELAHCFS